MKLSHRRKRAHKAKVRPYAWKAKRAIRTRREKRAQRLLCNTINYRYEAIKEGHILACRSRDSFLEYADALAVDERFVEYQHRCVQAFLTGYDRTLRDRRYDKQYHPHLIDPMKPNDHPRRQVDLSIWKKRFFPIGERGTLAPGEDEELMLTPGTLFPGIGKASAARVPPLTPGNSVVHIRPRSWQVMTAMAPPRIRKGGVWERFKAKMTQLFTGGSAERNAVK